MALRRLPAGQSDQPCVLLAGEDRQHRRAVSLRVNTASSPSSASCLCTRKTVAVPGSRAPMILLSLKPSPASGASADPPGKIWRPLMIPNP